MTTPSQNTEIRISRMFSTPIVTYRVNEPAALNEGLKQSILAKEQNHPSTGRSNIGGWRSQPDLLDWPGSEMRILLSEIKKAVGQVIASTSGAEGFHGHLNINAWTNLLRRGNYNTVHNHPESAWSGVYYVDVGSADPRNPLSGVLELLDPRPCVEMVATPGKPFGLPVRIQAENGLMVLFPSWLYHHVHPYTGDGARIAIAFNIPAMQTSA